MDVYRRKRLPHYNHTMSFTASCRGCGVHPIILLSPSKVISAQMGKSLQFVYGVVKQEKKAIKTSKRIIYYNIYSVCDYTFRSTLWAIKKYIAFTSPLKKYTEFDIHRPRCHECIQTIHNLIHLHTKFSFVCNKTGGWDLFGVIFMISTLFSYR